MKAAQIVSIIAAGIMAAAAGALPPSDQITGPYISCDLCIKSDSTFHLYTSESKAAVDGTYWHSGDKSSYSAKYVDVKVPCSNDAFIGVHLDGNYFSAVTMCYDKDGKMHTALTGSSYWKPQNDKRMTVCPVKFHSIAAELKAPGRSDAKIPSIGLSDNGQCTGGSADFIIRPTNVLKAPIV